MKLLVCACFLGLILLHISPVMPLPVGAVSHAQERFNLQSSLKRLKANPRYSGKVLGTRVVQSSGGRLVEVRILKPDDSIIIVYIDPATGGVVGESRY